MFDKIVTYEADYYQYKEKLENKQTLDLRFYKEDNYYFISLEVYTKRNKYNYNKQTGKLGLKPILKAKLLISLFIEFLEEEGIYDFAIVVEWTDNRRRDVYFRGLKTLGFKVETLNFAGNCFKCLIYRN